MTGLEIGVFHNKIGIEITSLDLGWLTECTTIRESESVLFYTVNLFFLVYVL